MIENRTMKAQPMDVLVWDGTEAEISDFLGSRFVGMMKEKAVVETAIGIPVIMPPGGVVILSGDGLAPPMYFQSQNDFDWVGYLFT